MARIRESRYFVADFETTVYEGQKETEVWAAACCELYTENALIFHSLEEQLEYFESLDSNLIVYYHNLKFDGSFILSYLLSTPRYQQAYTVTTSEDGRPVEVIWDTDRQMRNNTFKYSISDKGQWYKIVLKANKHIIEFRDSYKLLPFSVDQIGKSFCTKHKKLTMEYAGYRFAGCKISEEEEEYIKNDVYVVKEALEIMYDEGHKRLTIGSCCLAEYKEIVGGLAFDTWFPDLSKIPLEESIYGVKNADAYIRKAYRGGWCYLVRGKEDKVKYDGITLDVNSLYPSVMHSSSMNRYPVGEPVFWVGDYIPVEARENFYYIKIKTRFYIKEGKLPFIQIKNDLRYKGNVQLETSDVQGVGWTEKNPVILTVSCVDYQLMLEHYDLVDCQILSGCWFHTAIGIFDEYIDTYAKKKQTNTGALRALAKLFLNNLYGKLATSPDSGYKVAYLKPNGTVGFYNMEEDKKKVIHIAAGAAVTAYARAFTIRAAQQNYYGPDKPGFIYADTDSLHLDLRLSEVKGVRTHDTAFNCWKCEGEWEESIFVRQKTYIEKYAGKGYSVTCAGMPSRCKESFIARIESGDAKLTDFKVGFKIGGKLMPKRIRGGIVLSETTFEIK